MDDKKSGRKLQELKYNLNEIYTSISNRKFRHAVALFLRIESEYNESNNLIPLNIKKNIQMLKEELCLYLRINEAYVIAELGDLQGLRNELDYIYSNLYCSEFDLQFRPLTDYIKGNYKFCLEYYTYKITKRHFIDKHQSVKAFIQNMKLNKAMKEFSHLIILYNKLQTYLDDYEKDIYYSKLKSLFRDISTAKIVDLHSVLKLNVQTKVPNIVKKKKCEKLNFDNKFKSIRDMLDNGKIKDASDLLNKV